MKCLLRNENEGQRLLSVRISKGSTYVLQVLDEVYTNLSVPSFTSSCHQNCFGGHERKFFFKVPLYNLGVDDETGGDIQRKL
mmetsp:Transcript_26538/g.103361  ORF Transcript_26538/g.103361 Transcript_26538/m.103361 type:complete len:82 (-) Transcript_26538:617-862(-)